MLNTMVLLLQLAVAAGMLWGACRLFGKKLSRGGRAGVIFLVLLGMFVSMSVAAWAQPKRSVTLAALDRKSEAAEGTELTLSRIAVNGDAVSIPQPVSGQWSWYKGEYRWFMAGDERMTPGQTDSVTFAFPALDQVELVFAGNQWKGIVELEVDGRRQEQDTYHPTSEEVSFALPPLPAAHAAEAVGVCVGTFAASMLAVCALAVLVTLGTQWLWRKVLVRLERYGPVKKLLSFQFLFVELV